MSAHMNLLPTNASVAITLAGRDYWIDPTAAALVMAFVTAHQVSPQAPDAAVSAIPFMEATFAAAPGGRPAVHLRTLRWQRQLSQKALAKATGMQPAHLSAMERGVRPIGKVVAQRLAKVLGGDWRAFVTG